MVILSNLSENLKELMAERSINQVSLAAALGTGRTKLSDIMNGKNAPSYATFLLLIEFFHCSADFLLGLSEEPREEVPYNPVPPFGERIRALLRETGTSQYRFIRQTGLSWSVLHGWLTGTSAPSMDNLVRIAHFFDCSVDELLGRI